MYVWERVYDCNRAQAAPEGKAPQRYHDYKFAVELHKYRGLIQK